MEAFNALGKKNISLILSMCRFPACLLFLKCFYPNQPKISTKEKFVTKDAQCPETDFLVIELIF